MSEEQDRTELSWTFAIEGKYGEYIYAILSASSPDKFRRKAFGGVLFIVLAGAVGLGVWSTIPSWVVAGGFYLALALIFLATRFLLKNSRVLRKIKHIKEGQIRANADGVSMQVGIASMQIRWDDLKTFGESLEAFWFKNAANDHLLIPHTFFPNQETRSKFEALMAPYVHRGTLYTHPGQLMTPLKVTQEPLNNALTYLPSFTGTMATKDRKKTIVFAASLLLALLIPLAIDVAFSLWWVHFFVILLLFGLSKLAGVFNKKERITYGKMKASTLLIDQHGISQQEEGGEEQSIRWQETPELLAFVQRWNFKAFWVDDRKVQVDFLMIPDLEVRSKLYHHLHSRSVDEPLPDEILPREELDLAPLPASEAIPTVERSEPRPTEFNFTVSLNAAEKSERNKLQDARFDISDKFGVGALVLCTVGIIVAGISFDWIYQVWTYGIGGIFAVVIIMMGLQPIIRSFGLYGKNAGSWVADEHGLRRTDGSNVDFPWHTLSLHRTTAPLISFLTEDRKLLVIPQRLIYHQQSTLSFRALYDPGLINEEEETSLPPEPDVFEEAKSVSDQAAESAAWEINFSPDAKKEAEAVPEPEAQRTKPGIEPLMKAHLWSSDSPRIARFHYRLRAWKPLTAVLFLISLGWVIFVYTSDLNGWYIWFFAVVPIAHSQVKKVQLKKLLKAHTLLGASHLGADQAGLRFFFREERVPDLLIPWDQHPKFLFSNDQYYLMEVPDGRWVEVNKVMLEADEKTLLEAWIGRSPWRQEEFPVSYY